MTLPGGRHLAGEWTQGQLSGWVTQGDEDQLETLLYYNNCPQHNEVSYINHSKISFSLDILIDVSNKLIKHYNV